MANNTCGSGNPCGACKFLRRKCVPDCIFAPYFACDEGSDRFAAIHKIFGASNASKLLLHLPVHDRCEAVVTVAYEAQARIRDPVYGCVGHIFALQQQVAKLQAQCMQVKAHLAHGMSGPRSFTEENDAVVPNHMQSFPNMQYDHHHNVNFEGFSDYRICTSKDEGSSTKKRAAPHNYELGELQALAFKMMKD